MKISVVTPTLNQRSFLHQTLTSVLGQKGDFDLEHLVIDGASTDGTIDVLKSINDTRLRWISESDQGQASAINKGLAQATGGIVTWLNSDDLYIPGALTAVANAFEQNPQTRWLIGQIEIINLAGQPIRNTITRYRNRALGSYRYRKLLRENFIPQMGVFWRREFGESVGLLDETLHYTMDYDMWLRMGRQSTPLILNQTISQFRIHDTSKTAAATRQQFCEQYRVASRYFNGDLLSRCGHLLNSVKILGTYRIMRMFGG